MDFLFFQALNPLSIVIIKTQMPFESSVPDIAQFLASLLFYLSYDVLPPMRI